MIYIIGHGDLFVYVSNNNYKYLNTRLVYTINNDDIILKMDKYINEFVAQYCIAKYGQPEDYIGFCQYRRIIDKSIINSKEIIENNKTQIFTCTYNIYKNFLEKAIKNKATYELIYAYLYEYGAISVYNDFVEFMESQPIDIQQKIKEHSKIKKIENITTENNILYICGREIYVTNWNTFQSLVNFIESFIRHILRKYNINTIEEFSAFMDDNIYEIVDTEKICDKFTWFTTKENHKRIYGITIEFLIGIYLYSTTSTFYTKLYPFYWLS